MGEIALKDLFTIAGWDGIDERCNDVSIKVHIDNEVKTYFSINVEDAMKKLSQVGQLLQLAYSGSKGFNCSTFVLKVLSRYQDLIKTSVVTSSTFVEVVLQSLKFHKLAIALADKDKEEKALVMLKKCGDLAQRMADESDKLVQQADELCKLSEEALLETNKDHVTTEEDKKAVIDKAQKIAEERVKLEQQTRDLQEAVEEAREEAERHRRSAESNERKTYLRFIPLVGGGLANTADKRAEAARAKEEEAEKRRREYQRDRRSANAELAKAVTQLQNSNVEQDELNKAICSLEVAIKTLGKVKTVFLNTKVFWEGVHKQCKSLTTKHETAEILAGEDKSCLLMRSNSPV